jgi:DNA-binding XRE family transcriptional regulator
MVKKPNRLIPEVLHMLGDHLRKKRIERNMLQQDVANLIGVSEDCVTIWKNNRFQPQIQFYPMIISFLGYYPFKHETESFAGKVKLLRFINGTAKRWGSMPQRCADGNTQRTFQPSGIGFT